MVSNNELAVGAMLVVVVGAKSVGFVWANMVCWAGEQELARARRAGVRVASRDRDVIVIVLPNISLERASYSGTHDGVAWFVVLLLQWLVSCGRSVGDRFFVLFVVLWRSLASLRVHVFRVFFDGQKSNPKRY